MKKHDRPINPLQKCGPISHNEDHLQVLTPKVIDHGSINKIFDRSMQPLCRYVIKSEAIVIDRSCGYKKKCDRSSYYKQQDLYGIDHGSINKVF